MSLPGQSLQQGNLYSSWRPLQSTASIPAREEPEPAGVHTKHARKSTHSFFLNRDANNLQYVKTALHSPRSLFPWEQLPWADQSTRTCGTLCRTGWERSNLWPLRNPERPADSLGKKGTSKCNNLDSVKTVMVSDLVGCTVEERQRHGTLCWARAKLLRHICQAVPKSTSLVNDSLCNELTFPPLVVPSRPSDESKRKAEDLDYSAL